MDKYFTRYGQFFFCQIFHADFKDLATYLINYKADSGARGTKIQSIFKPFDLISHKDSFFLFVQIEREIEVFLPFKLVRSFRKKSVFLKFSFNISIL